MNVSAGHDTQTCRFVPIGYEVAHRDGAPVTYVVGRDTAVIALEHAVRLAVWFEMQLVREQLG
jgi:hypothetical protein